VVQNIALLYHPKIVEAERLARKVAETLAQTGVAAHLQSAWKVDALRDRLDQFDLLITFGGDGTILRTARACIPHRLPILGVDFGKLGFLAELKPEETLDKIPQVLDGDFWLEERMFLHVAHFRGNDHYATYYALNDAVVARGTLARVLEIHLSVDGAPITTYLADGLIISSSTGSTAYALAAGGLIMSPNVPAFMAIPIAPHLNVVRGLVVPADAEMQVMAHTHHEAVLSIDGQIDLHWHNEDNLIITIGQERSRLVRMRPQNYYYATLAQKLGQGPGAHHRFRTRKSFP